MVSKMKNHFSMILSVADLLVKDTRNDAVLEAEKSIKKMESILWRGDIQDKIGLFDSFGITKGFL